MEGTAILICSFFSPDYAEHAERLRASCQRFGYRHWIQIVPGLGSWLRNCNMKAGFIREVLLACDEPVLWLDADAVIEQRIEAALEFEEHVLEHDFAVFRDEARKSPKHHFRSGTLWFNTTYAAMGLVSSWNTRCIARPDTWDQESLYITWQEEQERGLKTHWLPESYCKIFDRGNVEDPHIVHFQASRELKEKKRA